MFYEINRRLAVAVTSLGLFLAARGSAAPDTQPAPPSAQTPNQADAKAAETTDDPSMAKLSSELKLFVSTETKSRDPADAGRREAIRRVLGLPAQKSRGGGDLLEVAIHLKAGTKDDSVGGDGIAVHFRQGDTLYASINANELKRIAAQEDVVSVRAMLPRSIPEPPKEKPATTQPQARSRDAGTPGAFDHQGLTGKGVIVGICDTGIHWRHPDFLRPDGTSRILYIYDFFDDSYNQSNGTIGSKPPFDDADHKPVGTLYTNEQINAALKGNGTVNSVDDVGHGTACAGTAAGNRSGDISGVAPEADIIFAKVLSNKPSKYGDVTYDGERWVLETAAKLNKPCVLSLSFGNHESAHDGNSEDEQLINARVGAGKPGAAVFIAAGNDALANLHGTQRFGPLRAGQADTVSQPIELMVRKDTLIVAYFDHRDDWQLQIDGKDRFFMDGDGKGLWYALNRSANGQGVDGHWSKAMVVPEDGNQFLQKNVRGNWSDKTDSLVVNLPAGRYLLFGRALSDKVPNGRFDVYVLGQNAALGVGVNRKGIVGSPGNADAAITVASYDFRSDWASARGVHVYHNMELGVISDYSSLGFRRDGVVKPDLAAPGRYTLSPAAPGSEMAEGQPLNITSDGLHIAWSGTSASSPYCAGVAALMLQKNPTLDAAQIKKILIETADHSLDTTGAVPNEEWGYGRLNPGKALAATPAAPPASFFHSDNTAPPAQVKDPIQQLQGTWKVVSAERPDRKQMSDEDLQKMSVVITGDKLTISEGDSRTETVFITLDPSKTPAWMDLKPASDARTSVSGIYKLDGDTLQLCWNKTLGGSRPASFTGSGDKADGEVFVLKLKLQK